MATIYPAPPQAQQPQYIQQAPQQQAASAPATQDPLFEALAKYIQSSPGPSYVSATQIQSIIDAQAALPGGTDYLKSVILPDNQVDFPGRIWNRGAQVKGLINMGGIDDLVIQFHNIAEPPKLLRIDFSGTAPGFTGIGLELFET